MTSTQRFAAQATLLMLAGFTAPASAFQPLITDDTGTQGSDANQLEFSISEDRAKAADDVERTRTFPIVYTRGLTETLDVFAGFSYARIRSGATGVDVSGSGNSAFGAKWRFYENAESKTSFALKPEILLPVGAGGESAGLGAGRNSGNLTLILTQEVAFGAVHVNAGVGRARFRDSSGKPDASMTRVSLAPVWDLSEHWKLALDLGTESAHAAGATVRSNFVELGAIWAPRKNVDFALGITRTSDDNSPGTTSYTATAGISWRFR